MVCGALSCPLTHLEEILWSLVVFIKTLTILLVAEAHFPFTVPTHILACPQGLYVALPDTSRGLVWKTSEDCVQKFVTADPYSPAPLGTREQGKLLPNGWNCY